MVQATSDLHYGILAMSETISSASTTNGSAGQRFRFVRNWPSPDADDGNAILDFWLREGALADRGLATARLPQVVMHARTLDDDQVAAVCTAVPVTPPRLGQPMYYFRMFVGKAWRSSRLIERMGMRAIACLEEHARMNDFPCIGIFLELENARFRDKGRMAVWPHSGFVYAGKSARGLELRLYYFRGARLKPEAKP